MTAVPSRLEIRLLGPVDVRVDGKPFDVDTRKATALLAYLAVVRRDQSRDRLADLFWPDAGTERARAALRRTLSTLRSGLGSRWVEADRSAVRLVVDDEVVCDVDAVSAALDEEHHHEDPCRRCLEALSAASELVRGEFMEGFAIRGCPEFDDWLMVESERLRRRLSTLFESLSRTQAGFGRYADAIETARRRLEVDPLSEDAHRRLMLLHAWSGDRSASSEAYRACVSVLNRELGVDPAEETTELHEAILEEDLPRAPAPSMEPRSESVAPAGYPLAGRDQSLAAIRSVIGGGAGVVLVEGEVGVGKTRLLEELASEVEASGARFVMASAHRAEGGVAYGPIQSALTAALEDHETSERIGGLPPAVSQEASRLLPALGVAPHVEAGDAAAKVRFFDAIAQVIAAVDDKVVLALDNLHWADGASVEFVAYLARRVDKLGIVLVLTRRPEDTPIDHPAAMLVDDLQPDAVLVRLDRLDRAAVAQLVEAAAVEGVDPDVVFEKSRGLPFFVVEYLEAARVGGTDLPGAIRRLLLGRLMDLSDVERQLLTTSAIVGVAADADLIRAVSGRSEDEVSRGLDALIGRSMLREKPDGSLDFVHEQLREVAYGETTMMRRRLLHRRAGDHLLSLRRAESDPRLVGMAAIHYLEAGNDEEAARLSVVAAGLAEDVFAFREAVDHLEVARGLGWSDGAELNRRIGDLRLLLGEYGGALAAYETARTEMAPGSPEIASVARACGEVYRRLGRWDVAAASFTEAWDTAADRGLKARIAADWAYVEHRRGDVRRANELVTEALQSADATEDVDTRAYAHNLAGLLSSESADRRHHLEMALGLAAGAPARVAILNNLALTLASIDDFEGAISYGRAALELAASAGDRHRTAALHDNLADFLHQSGDEEGAMTELKAAVALFAAIGVEPGALEPEVWRLKEW